MKSGRPGSDLRSVAIVVVVLGGPLLSGCLDAGFPGASASYTVPVSRLGDTFDLELPLTEPGRRIPVGIEGLAREIHSDGAHRTALRVSYPEFIPLEGFGPNWVLVFDLASRNPVGANYTREVAGSPPLWRMEMPAPGDIQLFTYLPFLVFHLEGRELLRGKPVPLQLFGIHALATYVGGGSHDGERTHEIEIRLEYDEREMGAPPERRSWTFLAEYSPSKSSWVALDVRAGIGMRDSFVLWHPRERGGTPIPWESERAPRTPPTQVPCKSGPTDGGGQLHLDLGEAMALLERAPAYASWKKGRAVALETAGYAAFEWTTGSRATWNLALGAPGTSDVFEAKVTRERGLLNLVLREEVESADARRSEHPFPPASWYPETCLSVSTLLQAANPFFERPPTSFSYKFLSGVRRDHGPPGTLNDSVSRPDVLVWELRQGLPPERGGGQLRVQLSGKTGDPLLYAREMIRMSPGFS